MAVVENLTQKYNEKYSENDLHKYSHALDAWLGFLR